MPCTSSLLNPQTEHLYHVNYLLVLLKFKVLGFGLGSYLLKNIRCCLRPYSDMKILDELIDSVVAELSLILVYEIGEAEYFSHATV